MSPNVLIFQSNEGNPTPRLSALYFLINHIIPKERPLPRLGTRFEDSLSAYKLSKQEQKGCSLVFITSGQQLFLFTIYNTTSAG